MFHWRLKLYLQQSILPSLHLIRRLQAGLLMSFHPRHLQMQIPIQMKNCHHFVEPYLMPLPLQL
jgi:hypothetical protein